MADVSWIKISTKVFDDEKISIIESMPESDTIIVIWFKLLVLAGRCNDCGMIYITRDLPYDLDKLAAVIRRPKTTVQMAIELYQRMGMINIVNDFIALVNWEKHQNVDKLELLQQQNRQRVSRYREKQRKMIEHNGSATPCNVTGNVTVTQCNAVDKDKDIDIDKEKRERRFTPPSPAEVQAYLDEKGIKSFSGDKFVAFYQSKGWMIGKNRMKDWRCAVRTWQQREQHQAEKDTRPFRAINPAWESLPDDVKKNIQNTGVLEIDYDD